MKTKQERLKIQNTLLALQDEAKAILLQLPNVVDVSIGLKEKDSKLTDDIVFQVYVTEKIGEQNLLPNQLVPKEILGHKTDVIIIPKAQKRTDSSEHRPIKGGIQIGNGKGHVGTLGCFARLTADDSMVLLSNHHVLFSDAAVAGDKIGQADIENKCCCCCAYVNGDIGVILNPSFDNDSIDCAIAKINAGIAPDIILNNSMTPTEIRIDGTTVAVIGDAVTKIGRTSGLTHGIINSVNGPASDKSGQIRIRPADTETFREHTNNKKAFSDSGDSGSVIMNDTNQIVGLLWGGDSSTDTVDITFACHISDVLDAFRNASSEIEIVNTPVDRAAHASRDLLATQRMDLDIREQLLETEKGQILVHLFEMHQKEVLNLINHNRAVKVVWHRHQGPAFTAHIANSFREENYSIPPSVKGIFLQELLIKMATVLKENGQLSLKKAIETHALTLIEDTYGAHTVSDFIKKITARQAAFA